MTSMHEQLRLRQEVWDRLGDTYASTLVRDGLWLAWWSGPPTGRLATSQPSPVTDDTTKLVTTLVLQGAIVPWGKNDLWGVNALIMVPKKDKGWRPALNLKPLNAYLRTD